MPYNFKICLIQYLVRKLYFLCKALVALTVEKHNHLKAVLCHVSTHPAKIGKQMHFSCFVWLFGLSDSVGGTRNMLVSRRRRIRSNTRFELMTSLQTMLDILSKVVKSNTMNETMNDWVQCKTYLDRKVDYDCYRYTPD